MLRMIRATPCRRRGYDRWRDTNISVSWCELWTDELMADELVDIKLEQNSKSQPIESNEKISHFLTPNLIDDQFPHSIEN